MSLGGQNNSPCYQKAIDYAHANNVVVCASAGNGDYKRDAKGDYIKDANGKCIIDTTTLNVTNYPAACNHVISVANVDSSNQRGELSIYNKFVDIAAPGTEIYNCVLNGGITNIVEHLWQLLWYQPPLQFYAPCIRKQHQMK